MKLINHVLDIRRLIQQAFDNRFSRMGLRADAPVPADQLSDSDHRKRRQKLDDIMQNHLNELGDYAEARQATINECVFTLFNRIAAIKVMESKELFPEIIRRRKENAGRSFEHNAWLEEHPSERNAEREGLKHFLNDQFDKLGEHIPLYRSDYPYALMPTADELNEIIVQFNNVEEDEDCGADVWKGDDILGWLYENFNAVEKEALKASGEKTEYNKVSLQSQVYTPAWVVKFLVDNTLGKSYLEMYPESSIKEKYKIANAPTKQVKHPKDLRSMRLLDPACGSGNFLIYSFSLFYDLYIDQMENYGKDYSRRDIPKMIVENNLFGMDLDERAAQISQIALFIKARELGGHRSHWPEYTNVVSTHFFLPEYDKIKDTFEILGEWSDKHKKAIADIWNDLCSAYKFGSLVRVEERLNELMPNDVNHSMFKEFEMENLFAFKNNITTQLRNQVSQWSGEGSNPYTLAKTNEAMDFLQIISQKYDVVVANPPYTDSADFGPELKTFVEENYKKPYKVNTNLYACFIKRCCEFAGAEGKVGMIHPLTFMYIKSFEDVRKLMLNEYHINILAELGLGGVFPNAQVDVAAYVIEDKSNTGEGVYINLTKYKNHVRKPEIFLEAYSNFIEGKNDPHVYLLPQAKLKKIKSYPFIYWISDDFRKQFGQGALGDYLKAKKGLGTDNLRFFRFWWEVDKSDISENYQQDHKKWVTYLKGGPYNKWYGNLWLVINWANDGYEVLHNPSLNLRNPDTYFKRGIGCSLLTSKGCSFRIQPNNCIYDSTTRSIFLDTKDYPEELFLAVLNSRLATYTLNCLNSTVATNSDDVHRVPFAGFSENQQKVLIELVKQNISIKKEVYRYEITEPLYDSTPIIKGIDCLKSIKDFFDYENVLLTAILVNEAVINDIVFDAYKLSVQDKQMVVDKEGIPVGDLPVSSAAKIAFKEWLRTNKDFLASEDMLKHVNNLEECDDISKISDFEYLYTNNKEWEEFCIQHNLNPIEVWYQFKNTNTLPTQRTQIVAFELLTDVVRSVLAKDDDGVIPLGDKMGEERLAIRIEREFMERGYSAAQFNQLCQLLGFDFEDYLQNQFFRQLSNHVKLFKFLPSTPFIWHLTSGEHHAIELYISIYKWNRDTLFRIRSIYAANREAAIRDRLNSIDTSKTEGRLEATELRAMLEELNSFCQKIDDLLASGYDPKLDDGVGKNIAPLQKRKMLSYEVLNAGQLKKYLNADW